MLGLLSVVSMIRFTVLFFSSLRIFSTMVRPSMLGMLTSATTSLIAGSALSFTSPSLPSTAVTTSSPLPFRKVDTSSRTVLESSTTSIFAMTVFPAVLEQFQLAAGLLDRGKSRDIDRGGTAHAQRDVHFHRTVDRDGESGRVLGFQLRQVLQALRIQPAGNRHRHVRKSARNLTVQGATTQIDHFGEPVLQRTPRGFGQEIRAVCVVVGDLENRQQTEPERRCS